MTTAFGGLFVAHSQSASGPTAIRIVDSASISQPAALAVVSKPLTGTQSPKQTPAQDYRATSETKNTVDTSVHSTDSELTDRFRSLSVALTNRIDQKLTNITSNQNAQNGGVSLQTFAQASRIDQLSGTRLSNVTVDGVTGLRVGDIPALNYLSSGGGSISGLLGIGTDSPTAQLTIKASGGGTNPFSITNNSGSTLFSVAALGTTTVANGLIIQSGCIYINGACLNPTGFTNYWVNSGNSLYNSSGSLVGINTINPSYSLDVAGFINTDQYSGYKQAGNTILYASSTNSSTLVGIQAGANLLASTTLAGNTAVGFQALLNATSSSYNTAFGYQALKGTTLSQPPSFNTGIGYLALSLASGAGAQNNTAVGYMALGNSIGGSGNTAVGSNALASLAGGYSNTAFGSGALTQNISGFSNSAFGNGALGKVTGNNNIGIGNSAGYNTSKSNNTFVGVSSAVNSTGAASSTYVGMSSGSGIAGLYYSNTDSVLVGINSGYSFYNGSDWNAFLGSNTGYNVTTGGYNTFLGGKAGYNITTGANNIAIGFGALLPQSAGSNQLNIGNIIFGTGLTATSSSTSTIPVPSGSLAIGTTTPSSRLTIWGTDTASTSILSVVNSASTTVFASYGNGNATYSGSLFQSSDQRLKTNITSLNATDSLALIQKLNPVFYTRLDQPDQGTTIGFIAQEVQQIFPSLVTVTTATPLTPGGTLTLNYTGLIAPLTKAVQALAAQVTGFADHFTTRELTFTRAGGDEVDAYKLCLGSTCITEQQLVAVLAAANQSGSTSNSGGSRSPTPTPPIITIAGVTPAHIVVGDTYGDQGATAKDSAGHDLTVHVFLDGVATSSPWIDTSATGSHAIDYVATDGAGLTSTSTRTVEVEALL